MTELMVAGLRFELSMLQSKHATLTTARKYAAADRLLTLIRSVESKLQSAPS